MLSVLFGEQFDIFRQILNFYKPNGGEVLDLTYGNGTLWRSKAKNEYNVTTVDIDTSTNAQYHCDFRNLPTEITCKQKDVIVYDPPYKYETQSFTLQNRKDKGWKDKAERTLWTLKQQIENATILNNELPKLLTDDGILIIKIMDTRIKGQLIPAHTMFINELTNFAIKDICVYIKLGVGVFVNNVSAQTAHGFFLIFKKKIGEK